MVLEGLARIKLLEIVQTPVDPGRHILDYRPDRLGPDQSCLGPEELAVGLDLGIETHQAVRCADAKIRLCRIADECLAEDLRDPGARPPRGAIAGSVASLRRTVGTGQ